MSAERVIILSTFTTLAEMNLVDDAELTSSATIGALGHAQD